MKRKKKRLWFLSIMFFLSAMACVGILVGLTFIVYLTLLFGIGNCFLCVPWILAIFLIFINLIAIIFCGLGAIITFGLGVNAWDYGFEK